MYISYFRQAGRAAEWFLLIFELCDARMIHNEVRHDSKMNFTLNLRHDFLERYKSIDLTILNTCTLFLSANVITIPNCNCIKFMPRRALATSLTKREMSPRNLNVTHVIIRLRKKFSLELNTLLLM